ncbi:MAG: efflux RND transporter permease subunit [Victivallaceae bacterium]
MTDKLLSFSIKNRWLMAICALGIIFLGISDFNKLPIDAVPDFTNKQVQINTAVTGLSPVEIEKQITCPIEWAVQGVPGIEEIRSVSFYGVSQVTAIFNDDVDIYRARQLLSERLAEAKEDLPASVGAPFLGPIWTGLGEIFFWSVEARGPKADGTKYSPTDLRVIQDWIIKPQMRGIPGLAEVNTIGGFERQYLVVPETMKLLAYGLTFRDVLEALAANNANVGGGYIEHKGEQYLIRSTGLIQNEEDIRNIKLGAHDGTPVYVKDVAEVTKGGNLRTGAATKNGNEVVLGTAILLSGENSRVVSGRVADKIKSVNKTLPRNVEIKTLYDRSYLVDATLKTVRNNLLEGAVLVVAVLFLMLGNIRAAMIVASVIPLSMCMAVTGMVHSKISGNLMSLGAIDFGIIVDGAVVMIENIVRRFSEKKSELGRDLNVSERLNLSYSSASEVAKPTVFGVAIIMIVYLPVLTLSGVEGKMFTPMAQVVLLALGGALALTFTVIPAFAAILLGGGKTAKYEEKFNHILKERYSHLLNLVFANKIKVAVSALVILMLSLLLFLRLGSEFTPRLNEGAIAIQPARIPSISLSESIRLQCEVEKELIKNFPDEIEGIFARTGTSEVVTDVCGQDVSDAFITLKPKSGWKKAKSQDELVAAMQKVVATVPGQNYEFSQPIELRMNELISGVRSDLAVKIYGEELETMTEIATRAAEILEKIKGAQDIKVEQAAGLPFLTIEVDRMAIARYGLNVKDVQDVVEIALGGAKAGEVMLGDSRFDLVVRLPDAHRADIEFLKKLPVPLSADRDGKHVLASSRQTNLLPYVTLSELAKVSQTEGPRLIKREDGKRRVVVQCNVRNRDLGGFVKEAQKKIETELGRLPEGYWIGWGGQFENLIAAQNRLYVVVPLALGLIFVLLFATFGNFKSALLVFTGVPFALTGGIFALWAMRLNFSVSAAIGFIALSGIAVLNGVVMMSFINRLRTEGMSLVDSATQGCVLRLRPVLMTAMVAAFGFIPMAISSGMGAEVQRPLAIVVIGGVISSTTLTLFVLPVLYILIDSFPLNLLKKIGLGNYFNQQQHHSKQ